MERDAPEAATPIFGRLKDVMSDKYRVADKFLIIASLLSPDTATGDAEAFKALKKRRDALFHGFNAMTAPLPSQDAHKLALKYFRLHVQHGET